MSATTTEKSQMPTSTSTNGAKKGKKRKRVKQSPEELYRTESTDRYNKLHHACSKHLHREAKVVKSFECQKIVRAIKAANDSLSASKSKEEKKPDQEEDDGEGEKKKKKSSKALKRLETLQQKLDRTKKMELEVLVQVGLKRLGVLSLDPRAHDENLNVNDEDDKTKKSITSSSNNSQSNTDAAVSSQSDDQFHQALLESMLQHKRLSAALDQLNEKVTEYRQWTIHREAMLRGEDSHNTKDQGGSKKSKKKRQKQQQTKATGNDTMVVADGYNTRKRGLDLGGHEGASGLFIGSLSGMVMDTDDYGEGGNDYMDGEDADYDDHYEYQTEKKKNRPGQRARKAKAMAIEARKAGKTWDSSINWREKKAGSNENNHHDGGSQRNTKYERGGERDHHKKSKGNRQPSQGETEVKPKDAQHIATMGKAWKEEGNAHPSWAAKAAAQKSQGIAKFQGTKITFD
mmetsp:Transcript_5417/g.11771  ORF Transcript_5417/g.11771 Transcript_5417/m.11771 type:complete len:459 (-) Transcript_5417:2295-3671(-)